MSDASRLDSARLFRQIRQDEQAIPDQALTLPLPPVDRLSYDLAAVCRSRFSPETEFVLKPIALSQLAALLREATASFTYRNDLDGPQERPEPRVCLYGCFYGVEDVPDGAYRYDGAAHSLQSVCLGDHRQRMQEGMSLPNINLFQVPLCLHVAGKRGSCNRSSASGDTVYSKWRPGCSYTDYCWQHPPSGWEGVRFSRLTPIPAMRFIGRLTGMRRD